jgi:hypothetical protein
MLCAVAFSMESISIPQIAHFIICPSSCFKVSSTEKILPCQQKSLPLFDKWERILIDYLGYPILPVNLHRYAQEKAGTGTTDMIADCRKAGLPEPDFEQCGPHFVVTVWRDWLTDEVLAEYNLNDRQKKAVVYLKTHGKISNTEYQQVANSIKKTATRDLNDLKKKGIISQVGSRGPGVHYVITKKRDKMGTMGT